MSEQATRILFVCHGNICRSPMAEFVMKDLVRKRRLENRFLVASAATSTEEIGNDIHWGTRRVLTEHGVPFAPRSARRLRADDATAWDYIVGMDEANVRNIGRMLGPGALGRTFKLLTFAGRTDDVADPWYTGDFETTYRDVLEGCTALLERIESEV